MAGRFAPKILTGIAVDDDFSAVTLAPKIMGSPPRRTSFTSMPVSSYEPVYHRPHMFRQSRSTNNTSRHGCASPPRPRHWYPVYTMALPVRVTVSPVRATVYRVSVVNVSGAPGSAAMTTVP